MWKDKKEKRSETKNIYKIICRKPKKRLRIKNKRTKKL